LGAFAVWQARPRHSRGMIAHKRELFIKIYYTALNPMSKRPPA
jgi:hypothetical protein